MYNVVSVLPCIVEANLPIKESGPYVAISSVVIPNAAVPEIGRMSAKGMISGGIPIAESNGEISVINASNAPELLRIEIDTIIPTKKGSKENAILTPSLPPSTNNSYVGIFCHVAIMSTNKIKQGMIHVLTIEIIPILLYLQTYSLKSFTF